MTATPVRYRWECHPNPDMQTLHVTAEMPRKTYFDDRPKDDPGRVRDEAFVRAVEAVPGVTDVYTGRYHLSVAKAPLFDWGRVRADVIALAGDHFGERVEEEGGDP